LADLLYSSVAWLSLFLSALFGLGFLVIRLMPMQLPIRVFYTFLRFRRWVLGATLVSGVAVFIIAGLPTEGWIFIGLQVLFLLIDPISDEARIFRAVDVPKFEEDPTRSMLDPKTPVIVLEVDGDVRAYPLTYVAHHEIINDRIGGKKVIVSFCNQCNSAISYDATDYSRKRGFAIASEYGGNMVMEDLDTHTIWQQVTGDTLAGSWHPSKLPVMFSRLLPWDEVQSLFPQVELAKTTAKERLPFGLRFFPWNRLQRSNYILGLRQRDRRLPARARVLGMERIGGDLAFLKDEVTRRGWIRNDEVRLLIVMTGECANGFLTEVDGLPRELFVQGGRIIDKETGSVWNLRGRGLEGPLKEYDLVVWQVRDQFWYAWSNWHILTKLVRIEA
jgi:hypothetical protein